MILAALATVVIEVKSAGPDETSLVVGGLEVRLSDDDIRDLRNALGKALDGKLEDDE